MAKKEAPDAADGEGPVPEMPAVLPVALSDANIKLLTDARTQKWKLEQYEFAYDASVRWLHALRVAAQFAGFFVAVAFLFLRYVVKEDNELHTLFGLVGRHFLSL